MINYKIYLLLLAIAFLSFSCDEDEKVVDLDEKKDVELSTNAFDYIFLENKTYTYKVIGNEKYGNNENVKVDKIKLLETNEYFFNQNRISLDLGNSQIISADSSIIYTYGDFFYFSKITMNRFDWLTALDFSKENWTIFEKEVENDSTGKLYIKENALGRKVKEIEFDFEGKKYKGFEFVLETNTDLYFYNNENKIDENTITKVIEIVRIVSNLGIVYYEVNLNSKELISGTENIIETISTLVEVKEKSK